MKSFDAVLFDFDGVIVDSTPIHLEGWKMAYNALVGSDIPSHVLSELPGQSTVAIGTQLTNLAQRPELKAEMIKRKARYVLEHLHDIPLVEGIGEFLHRLTKARVPYGIASNAPRGFLEAALRKHSLHAAFYLGLEDYEKPKPDPEPYLKGAQRLEWKESDRRRIAVFEDSAHGIHAAIGAGMVAIGVCTQHPSELLKDAGATYCIADFRDVGFLEKHFFEY